MLFKTCQTLMASYASTHLSKLRGLDSIDEDRLQHVIVFLELLASMSEKGQWKYFVNVPLSRNVKILVLCVTCRCVFRSTCCHYFSTCADDSCNVIMPFKLDVKCMLLLQSWHDIYQFTFLQSIWISPPTKHGLRSRFATFIIFFLHLNLCHPRVYADVICDIGGLRDHFAADFHAPLPGMQNSWFIRMLALLHCDLVMACCCRVCATLLSIM